MRLVNREYKMFDKVYIISDLSKRPDTWFL